MPWCIKKMIKIKHFFWFHNDIKAFYLLSASLNFFEKRSVRSVWFLLIGHITSSFHLFLCEGNQDMRQLLSARVAEDITQWNNCMALQLCDKGISSITQWEKEVRWKWGKNECERLSCVCVFVPKFYMISSSDLFTVLADQDIFVQ